jgi:hypothetical protein
MNVLMESVMTAKALTVGVLAERLSVPIHRAQYLLRAKDISPVQRAGKLEICDEAAVRKLQDELGRARRA